MTPPERSFRVSSRVSMSAMATMLLDDEVVAQRALRAPVAGNGRLVANDEAGHLRLARLDVVGRDAVIANLGAGHRHDLTRVGRVGEDFLVAGEARVEYDLAVRFSFGAGREPTVNRAVFQCEYGFFHISEIVSRIGRGRSDDLPVDRMPSALLQRSADLRLVLRPSPSRCRPRIEPVELEPHGVIAAGDVIDQQRGRAHQFPVHEAHARQSDANRPSTIRWFAPVPLAAVQPHERRVTATRSTSIDCAVWLI